MSRALREQIHWEKVRARANETPFARAFFVLLDGLDIVPEVPPKDGGEDDPRLRVDVTTA